MPKEIPPTRFFGVNVPRLSFRRKGVAFFVEVESLFADDEAQILALVGDGEFVAVAEVESHGIASEVRADNLIERDARQVNEVAVVDARDRVVAVAVAVEEQVAPFAADEQIVAVVAAPQARVSVAAENRVVEIVARQFHVDLRLARVQSFYVADKSAEPALPGPE